MELIDLLQINSPVPVAVIACLSSLIGAFAYAIRRRNDEKKKREMDRAVSHVEAIRRLVEAQAAFQSATLDFEHEKRKREYPYEDEKPKNEWSLDGEIVYIAKAENSA